MAKVEPTTTARRHVRIRELKSQGYHEGRTYFYTTKDGATVAATVLSRLRTAHFQGQGPVREAQVEVVMWEVES